MSQDKTPERTDDIAVALFGELFMADQLARNRISKVLPKGMELSHFSVLKPRRRYQKAQDAAVVPLIGEVVQAIGADRVRALLTVLRELRVRLEDDGT